MKDQKEWIKEKVKYESGIDVLAGIPIGWNACEPEWGIKCHECGSVVILYRDVESSCGGYEDTHYRCCHCNYDWWIDGDDG